MNGLYEGTVGMFTTIISVLNLQSVSMRKQQKSSVKMFHHWKVARLHNCSSGARHLGQFHGLFTTNMQCAHNRYTIIVWLIKLSYIYRMSARTHVCTHTHTHTQVMLNFLCSEEFYSSAIS